MKAILICPAYRPAVPQLAEAAPLAILPILGESLVNYWLEHLAALGAREITVIAADRPAQVRAATGDGSRWGVRVEVVAAHAETDKTEAAARFQAAGKEGWLTAPHDIVVMNHLPDCPEHPLFESYAGWYRAVSAWMPRALTPTRVRVTEREPGVWIGADAHIAPSAKLCAPCWIGEGVSVAAGAIVGPGAVIEERSVIDEGSRVTQSVVWADTFVGRMTCIADSFAIGSVLTNWRTESILRVPDAFLLCSLAVGPTLPEPNRARGFAMLTRLAGKPAKLFSSYFLPTNRAGGTNLPH